MRDATDLGLFTEFEYYQHRATRLFRVAGSPHTHIVTDSSTWKHKVTPIVYGQRGTPSWVFKSAVTRGL